MVDPLAVIGVVAVAFSAAAKSWEIVQDALDYKNNSEASIIRLELARARFDTWAYRSGLASGALDKSLVPLSSLIVRTLEHLSSIFSDADILRTKYGLAILENENDTQVVSKSLVSVMRQSLRAAGIKLKAEREKSSVSQALTSQNEVGGTPGRVKRLTWSLKDKDRFGDFITRVESLVTSLQNLLQESQQVAFQNDIERYNLEIVGRVSNSNSLVILQTAVRSQIQSQADLASLARLKDVSISKDPTSEAEARMPWGDHSQLNNVSRNERQLPRFLQTASKQYCFLWEKKDYESSITPQDKEILKNRVERLTTMLNIAREERNYRTVQPVNIVDDPEYHCWWTVFVILWDAEYGCDVEDKRLWTLRDLYQSPRYKKPPLEHRFALAQGLSRTLAKLYGSDWMHKGLSSDNIVFSEIFDTSRGVPDINDAVLAGFNYSRQQTEAQTIDKGKIIGDMNSAIYRHPSYQGPAASGYKLHYDIYSFGLILFEIAIWMPLRSMLVRPRSKPEESILYPEMKFFHREEALELQKRVLRRVDSELAFRVGSKYCEAVKWCLGASKEGGEVLIAVEFYNRVVVPLDGLVGKM